MTLVMDKNMYIKIIILAGILTFVFQRIGLFYVNSIEMINYNEINLDNVVDIADSGDIIITRWYHVDLGIRLFSKFCHVGMVNKDEKGKLTLIELHPKETDDDGSTKEGVNVYPFKERIKELDCTCYFLKCTRNFKINLDNLDKYKKVLFDKNYRWNFVKYWMQHQLRWDSEKNLKEMYCSQLIGFILQDSNILHENFNIHTLSPASFEHLYDNLGKKIYGQTYKINC